MATIPLDEQIRLLLQGKAYDTVRALFPGKQLTGGEYKEVFAVTRKDVVEYVKRKGFPPGSYSNHPGGVNGPYMIEEEGAYAVYYQERGIRFDETRYAEKVEADEGLITLLLGLSGTGLYGKA